MVKILITLILFIFLTSCSDDANVPLGGDIDRIGGQPIDGMCGSGINECNPGRLISADEYCNAPCTHCWFCGGVNGGRDSDLCKDFSCDNENEN